MRIALLLLALLPLLIGCPTESPDDDDDLVDDDDTADDDDVVDDDDTGDDDDATDDDDVVDDDDATPPLPDNAIAKFPSFASDRVSDWSGESVSILGDVNGDGFDDFAIGAPGAGLKEEGSAPGQLFLFFGKAEPDWGVGTPLTDADVAWEGTANDDLGFNVVGPGDWNGDGLDDIVVSAPLFPQGNAQAGRVWIIPGRSSGWPAAMGPIADDAIEVFPEVENSKLGTGLGAIGDVNNDGLPDFAASSPLWTANEGRIYVFFGRTGPVIALAASTADVLLNPGCSTCFGSVTGNSIAGLGDVNGDGIDDFAIGAPQARPSDGDPLGRVYVVHGAEDLGGTVLLEPDDGPAGAATIIVGPSGNSDFGLGLAGGDLDGDGINDLLVGAPHNDDNPFDRGAMYVFSGADGGLGGELTIADASAVLAGTSELESVGHTPALGDFDGDGDLDLALGCPESAGLNDPLARSGRIYLINDPPSAWVGTDPLAIALATWFGNEYPQWVGESVSVGGDINGDGYDDVLVGANKSSVVAERAGQTYLLLGGPAADLAN